MHCEATRDAGDPARHGVAAEGPVGRSTFNGATANALVPDTLTDIAGGACFNDARVQVELSQDTDRAPTEHLLESVLTGFLLADAGRRACRYLSLPVVTRRDLFKTLA